MIKLIILTSLFLLIINLNLFHSDSIVLAQTDRMKVVKNNTWISKQNNLNVTMNLQPKIPVVDDKTKIIFEIKKLNNSDFFENLNAKVTMTDSDGRLFKFNNQSVSDGKFSVEYLFPSKGEHRVILQLYQNESAFAVGSFDIVVPQTPPPSGNLLSNIFKNIF
jgi:hypothetical protein